MSTLTIRLPDDKHQQDICGGYAVHPHICIDEHARIAVVSGQARGDHGRRLRWRRRRRAGSP